MNIFTRAEYVECHLENFFAHFMAFIDFRWIESCIFNSEIGCISFFYFLQNSIFRICEWSDVNRLRWFWRLICSVIFNGSGDESSEQCTIIMKSWIICTSNYRISDGLRTNLMLCCRHFKWLKIVEIFTRKNLSNQDWNYEVLLHFSKD